MPTEHIVALLIAERDKLNLAIEALGGTTVRRPGRPRKDQTVGVGAVAVSPVAPTNNTHHHMRTPAARRAQAERMKAYWRKRKRQGK